MYITMPQENLYNIMGVEKNASQETIKKRFRKLSMTEHPDKHPPGKQRENATKKFQNISAAHDILGDEEKRRMYDITGDANGETNGGDMFRGGIPVNPEELFNLFSGGNMGGLGGLFGGGGPGGGVFHMNVNGHPMHFQQAMRQPRPIQEVLQITLAEAYSGITKRLEIDRVLVTNQSRTQEKETLYITIPPGIDNNEVITIKGKGNVIDGTNYGDVKVVIIVNNNTEFMREGIDLIYNKTISLKDALCGFHFDMKYIDGRIFKINNDNGNVIEPGHKKIIRSMGMNRDGHTGNLTIVFKIVFPNNISHDKIKKLSEIL
jgi:DnaJ-class molecular chaperone